MKREPCVDACVAAFRIAPAFLASLAFNSITFQPMSAATALATVVLPTPGGPIRSKPGFVGLPSTHWSNQERIFFL